MFTLEKIGRMSLNEVERRRPFVSAVVCKDTRNQYVIVGCRTYYFRNYGLPYIQGEIKDKVHIGKAIIRAHSRGRMIPNEDDMYNSRTVRFRVVDGTGLNPNQAVDIYLLH